MSGMACCRPQGSEGAIQSKAYLGTILLIKELPLEIKAACLNNRAEDQRNVLGIVRRV